MKKSLPLLGFILLIGCNQKESSLRPEVDILKNTQLANAEWLLGRWENNSAQGNLSEIWSRVNDSVFSGAAYFVIQNDTVFNEAIVLAKHNGKLVYRVTVPTQYQSNPVVFTSTRVDRDHLEFANPTHDYPNKIEYRFVKPDSLIAKISGIKDGKPAFEIFLMRKR